MTPLTRKENYLNEIVGWGETAPEKPLTPEEFFFAAILGEAVQTPEPLSRYQIYLAKIAGRNISVPKPLTRLELFLAKACGMDVETPTPITREEIFWSNYHAIVDFEVGGIPPLTYKAVASALKDYKISGNTIEGESVGDKTDNLWNVEIVDNYSSYSNGKISPYDGRCTNIEPIVVDGNSYTLSYSSPLNATCIVMIKNSGELISRVFKSGSKIMIDTSGGNELYITWLISDAISITSDMIQDIMLNIGSTALPYEPYGYRVPVEINDYTATLYLPEPIKMVGDEAEYIDYGEQKQHRVRKNLLNYSSIEIGGFDFSTGEKVPDSSQLRTSTPIKVKPYESYAISGVASGQVRVFLYDGNMNMISTVLRSDNSVVETTGSTVFVNVAGIKSAWSEQIQLEIGSEATGYEPYIEDTELDITLPALPTLSGTNILSIGTTVQPSKVYIKGEKEREYT